MRRWLIRGGIFLAGVALLVLVGFWVLLQTPVVAQIVATKIERITGGRVSLDEVTVSLRQSSLSGLSIYPTDVSDPWLTLQGVQADISLWDLVSGSIQPSLVLLQGVKARIEFDTDGNWQVELPESESDDLPPQLPRLQLASGRLELHQEGKPEARFENIEASLTPDQDVLVLSGKVEDEDWGRWTVSGQVANDVSSGEVVLKTRQAHATPQRLRSIPFIPAEVWQQVEVEGDTSADVRIRYAADLEQPVHYQVALAPEKARVIIAALDQTVTEAHGGVTVEDGLVTLNKVAGRVADGEVAVDGTLDFRSPTSELSFTVEAKGWQVDKLPASWKFPKRITGRLYGKAELNVRIQEDGSVRTSGSGSGEIRDAKVAGIATDGPIQMNLNSTGDRFQFAQSRKMGANPDLPSWLGLVLPLIPLAQPPMAEEPQEEKPEKEDVARLDVSLGFRDVSLEELLERLEITPPFPLSGRLTIQVKAGIPTDGVADLQNYLLDGKAELSTLTIAGMQLRNVRTRLLFRDGVLALEEFDAELPGDGSGAGSFDGEARLGVSPPGDLTAKLKLDAIPVANLARLAGEGSADAAGSFSGDLEFTAPAGKLTDRTAWEATATLKTDKLQAFNWTLTDARFRTELRDGTLHLIEDTGSLEGIQYQGVGKLSILAPYGFEASLELAESELEALQKLSPSLRPPVAISGKLTASANASGTLEPLKVEVNGRVATRKLKINAFAFNELTMDWRLDQERFAVTDLRGQLYDGKVQGKANVPFATTESGSATLTLTGVDLADMTAQIPSFPVPLAGKADARIAARLPQGGKPPQLNFTLGAPGLKVRGIPTEKVEGKGTFEGGVLRYQAQGKALGGSFDLEGRYPGRSAQEGTDSPDGSFSFEQLQLPQLWDAFGLTEFLQPLTGQADVRFAFRLAETNPGFTGTGAVRLQQLRWDDTELTPRLTIDVGVSPNRLRLRTLDGSYAGGAVTADYRLNLTEDFLGLLTLQLRGGRVDRLVTFIPVLKDRVSGTVNLSWQGRVGSRIAGRGQVDLIRGEVLEIPVRRWSFPFAWRSEGNSGQIYIRNSTASVVGGRVRARGQYNWGNRSLLEGKLDFTNLDLGRLLASQTDSSFAQGRATGRLSFRSTRPSSLDALRATMSGQLQQTQAFSFPVLTAVGRNLPSGRFRVNERQSGSYQATLTRGVVRIDHLGLSSSSLQLLITGRVTLSGRLNLGVIANPILLDPGPLVTLLSFAIPVGPVPLGVLLEAAEILSATALQFQVRGTTRQPVVRFTPLRALTPEGFRFFVSPSQGRR